MLGPVFVLSLGSSPVISICRSPGLAMWRSACLMPSVVICVSCRLYCCAFMMATMRLPWPVGFGEVIPGPVMASISW